MKPIDFFEHALKHTFGLYAPGLARAARRSLVEQTGFYDNCILGAGDRALACALNGSFEHSVAFMKTNEQEKLSYLEWAQAFNRDSEDRAGFVPGNLLHLWHGSLPDRRYGTRHVDMAPYGFNRFEDIKLDEAGLLKWSSDKPALLRFVAEFFSSRREDG
ncbi:MAG: hypothetical protein KJT03_15955 [Verrucomicrobiae bacterium]|nr:hypothetical protein [Verrucomicrobiae bacterium]